MELNFKNKLSSYLIRAVLGSGGLRIAGMALSFIIGVQLARGLGADGYGIYGLAMSVVALVTVPIEFGLPFLVTREVAIAHANQDWGRIHGVIKWATLVIFISVLTLYVVVGVLFFLFPNDENKNFYFTIGLGLVLIPIVALANIRSAALRSIDRILIGQIPELIVRPGIFAVLLFFAFGWVNVEVKSSDVMILNLVSAFLALILVVYFLNQAMPSGAKLSSPVVEGKRWLKSVMPMALTEGLRIGQGHAAILLLGILSTTAVVGSFRVADSTALMCALPISLMNIVGAPLIAKLYSEGEINKLRKLLVYMSFGMTVGVACLMLPLFFRGEYLVKIVFGIGYESSLIPLKILCLGYFLCAIFGVGSTLLNMTGHERCVTRALIYSMTTSLVCAIIFIPYWGGVGAALSNVFGMLVWNVKLWFDAKCILGVDSSLFGFVYKSSFDEKLVG